MTNTRRTRARRPSKSGSNPARGSKRPTRGRGPATTPSWLLAQEAEKRSQLLVLADPQIRDLAGEALAHRHDHVLMVADPVCPLMATGRSASPWLTKLTEIHRQRLSAVGGNAQARQSLEAKARSEAELEAPRILVGLIPLAGVRVLLELLRGEIDVDGTMAQLVAPYHEGEFRIFSMSGQSLGVTPAIAGTSAPAVDDDAKLDALAEAAERELTPAFQEEALVRRDSHVVLVADRTGKPSVTLVPIATLTLTHQLRAPLATDHVRLVIMVRDDRAVVVDHDLRNTLAAISARCQFTAEERHEVEIDGQTQRMLNSRGMLKLLFHSDPDRLPEERTRGLLRRYQRVARAAVEAEQSKPSPRPLGEVLVATFGDGHLGTGGSIGFREMLESVVAPKLRPVLP